MGEKVLLFSEKEEIGPFENLRLLIIDFNLRNHPNYQLDDNSGIVAKKIDHISKRWKYFLTIVWTVAVDEEIGRKPEIKERILYRLKNEFGNDFDETNLLILPKLEPEDLVPALEEWISTNNKACLLFEWEKTIELKKDEFFKQAYDSNVIQIVQNLTEQYGREETSLQLSQLFFRIFSRYVNPVSTQFKEGIKRIAVPEVVEEPQEEEEINQQLEAGDDWYSKFSYLQSYFKPSGNSPMTGDLYHNEGENGFDYLLVLNPKCDLIQRKTERLMFIRGCKIPKISRYARNDEDSMQEFIKNVAWKQFVVQDGQVKKTYYSRTDFVSKLFNGGLKDRFYPIFYVKDNPDAQEYYHLILDFYKIYSIETIVNEERNYVKPEDWNLICRLDTPIIDDIVNKYGTFCTRIGTPDLLDSYKSEEIDLHKVED